MQSAKSVGFSSLLSIDEIDSGDSTICGDVKTFGESIEESTIFGEDIVELTICDDMGEGSEAKEIFCGEVKDDETGLMQLSRAWGDGIEEQTTCGGDRA